MNSGSATERFASAKSITTLLTECLSVQSILFTISFNRGNCPIIPEQNMSLYSLLHLILISLLSWSFAMTKVQANLNSSGAWSLHSLNGQTIRSRNKEIFRSCINKNLWLNIHYGKIRELILVNNSTIRNTY